MINKFKVQSAKCKVLILFLLLAALPLLPATNYRLLTVSADWIFNPNLPTCSISQGSTQYTGTTITITVLANDSSGIQSITLNPSLTPSSTSTATSMTNTYSWTPATAGTYSFTATITNGVGNTSSCTTNPAFTITDIPAPQPPGKANIGPVSCTNTIIPFGSQAVRIYWTNLVPPIYQATIDWLYIDDVTGVTETYAPGVFDEPGPGGSFSIRPGLTYNVTLTSTAGTSQPTPFTVPYCPLPAKPNISQSLLNCTTQPYFDTAFGLSGINNQTPVSSVQVSPNAGFSSPVYTRQVTTTANQAYNIQIPRGAVGDIWSEAGGWSGTLSLQPGVTYWARVANGPGRYSPASDSFSIPLCPCDLPTCGACTAPAYNTCSNNGTSRTCQLDRYSGGGSCTPGPVYTDPDPASCPSTDACDASAGYVCASGTCTVPPPIPAGFLPLGDCQSPGKQAGLYWTVVPGATYYNVRWIGTTIPNWPYNSYGPITTTPGQTYSNWGITACNDAGCSAETAGAAFECSTTPWIQTSGGDVHSNTGINAPGGP